MTELGKPEAANLLYGDRGEVPVSYPIMQGDVFDRLLVPGLSDVPITVIVAAHPCSMRRGAVLAERIAVAPVKENQQRITETAWNGYGNMMLLPSLYDDDRDYAADFREITSVASTALNKEARIAVLSADGILLFQQRCIHFFTRFKVPLDDLSSQALPILTEIELQRDWSEAALDQYAGEDVIGAAGKAEADFQEWLDENNRARRNMLSIGHQHAQLRRDVRAEIKERYGSQ